MITYLAFFEGGFHDAGWKSFPVLVGSSAGSCVLKAGAEACPVCVVLCGPAATNPSVIQSTHL